MSKNTGITQKIRDIFRKDPGFNRAQFARENKCDPRLIRRVIAREKTGGYPMPPYEKSTIPTDETDERVKRRFNQQSGEVEVNSFTCHTLEQALDLANIDLKNWKVDRYEVNNWQVTVKVKNKDGTEKPETKTNWQVKMWLKPRIVEPLELAIRGLIKQIPKFKPPKTDFSVPKGDFAGEMALYDAHIGKLAWKKEVTQGDQDLNSATEVLIKACEDNLNHLSAYKLSKIYYILGNDFMHVENYMGITPKAGHGLDTDSRLPKIYQKAKESFLETVYLCRSVAPVEVLWIPGNHDIHASYFLSEVIKEHFRNDKFVKVDNGPEHRKARAWGNLLVGFAHDGSRRQVNFVNVLPHFFPEMWGKSKFREWHVGHKHKKEEIKYWPTQSSGGTIIRQIPTLSTIDFWHYENIFVDAVPAGESFVWDKGNGVIAHYTANVNYE